MKSASTQRGSGALAERGIDGGKRLNCKIHLFTQKEFRTTAGGLRISARSGTGQISCQVDIGRGPAVRASIHKGFGTRLLHGEASHSPGGDLQLGYEPDRLYCDQEVPYAP